MVDKFENNNEIVESKEGIIKPMTNMEYYPDIVEEDVNLENHLKLPISKITTLGTGFLPLITAIQGVSKDGGGKSGLYRVVVPKGMHLAEFNEKSGYLGSLLNENNQISGQATLKSISYDSTMFDPTMLFMAGALMSIDKKLADIKEMQQEILNFLVQKEKSELKGDLNFLSDILSNYKYNWNNDKYKNSNHIKVLDIRQSAERKIDFYRQQIKTVINKKSLFHTEQLVKKQMDKIQSHFKDYQLALYLFSFSSFLEVMLLENFDAEYLNKIVDKIEDYSFKYRELYTKSYNKIEGFAKSSLESHLVKSFANVNKFAGKAMSKASIFSKSQFDEKLIESGDKLGKFGLKRIENTMEQFVGKQNSYVRPFIENINTVNKFYNQPMELLFDQGNMYIGEIQE